MSLRNWIAGGQAQGAARWASSLVFATVLSVCIGLGGTPSAAQTAPADSPAPAAPAETVAPVETMATPKVEADIAAPAKPSLSPDTVAAPKSEAEAPALAPVTPSTAPSPAEAAPSVPLEAEPAAQPKPSPAPTVDAAHLPRDLSPWSMFMAADIVVKAVMIGLAFASVVTWTVWLAKSVELMLSKTKLAKSYARIYGVSSLAEAYQNVGVKRGIVPGLIELAALELRLSADAPDKAGIKERISSRLEGLAAAAGREMNRGTGVLATIGATAPFVGLFGTVWGIMNSFIGISESQTTNLAIVAPGIAEALLATAIGLVAAIPAVIVYNQFSRSISGYKAAIAEAVAEVMRLVSRDLDRGLKSGPVKAAG